MKRLLLCLLASSFAIPHSSCAAEPLRVFIRAGKKSHGPGAHDFPQFLKDWVPMLNERGAKADGSLEFPTKEQLDKTDVLILHAQEAGNIQIGEERKNLLEFIARGGGIVTIHAGAVSRDPAWFKSIVGGSWNHERPTKWLEGPMHLYFTDRENPITKDMSNFAMDDEIYYDMDLLPECQILAGAYTPKPQGTRNEKANKRAEEITQGGKVVSIYDIQPQVWTYERNGAIPSPSEGGKNAPNTTYRAFTCIPGHYHKNFSHPTLRALLLRGIAWAGKRENADELCKPEELGDNLRYVEGGPTRPEKAAEKIEVHPEFDLSLVAAEPLINKVMNIDWDEKGRLWVCETPEYPNGRRELNVEKWKDSGSWTKKYDRDPIDRISWLEDTNGDGVMDKKHVFADKLELVTSFCFYKNGVIACAAPDIWNLQDTDGDGVADKREKLYTNLGTGDTHAVINNLRWGLDGWVYATHGYSGGNVTAVNAPNKPAVGIGSGVVRFKPDGTEIEQYASRGGNTWGLDITSDGQVFFTQPTSGTVFFHVVLPEYVLAKGKIPGTTSWKGMISGQKTFPAMSWPEQAYVQIDLVGQFTAAAGCAIYEGGAWPEKWNYSYFTTEPTLNIVHHQFVEKGGVSYKTRKEPGREETEFMRSKDLWFRPIETRVGPDGALYVVDFYNQAVIHNDTRGPIHGPANAAVRPDRDHYFGRVWKVNHKQAKPVAGSFHHHSPDSKGTMGSSALRTFESKADALATFKSAQDDWTRSAVIAAAVDHADDVIAQALKAPEGVEALVAALLPSAKSADKLITAAAEAGHNADALKIAILQGIAQQRGEAPALTPALTGSLKKLLANASTAGAALPLVAKWDKAGALADEVKAQIEKLSNTLSDNAAPVEGRLSAASALSNIGSEEATAKVVAALAASGDSEALQSGLVTVLEQNGHAQALVSSMVRLKPKPLSLAFDAILKRPEAALALLSAIADGKVDPKDIGPGNIARLRTHPNKNVAKQANAMMDKLNPGAKAKNEIIAKLTPEVEKPGNLANGKAMFTAACAVCHKLGDIGKDVAPPLVGMGAHGPAELLVHIVDPNREVDPSFWAWNITKKNGDVHVGVITGENAASINLRNQGGDVEIKKSDIATRENTRRSLMPEGLDALGPEILRDILAFICGSGDQKYRVIDLRAAYNADSRVGIFRGEEFKEETVTLHKFGNVTVHGVPFFIMDPEKSQTGASIIALKGGGKGTVADHFPTQVEIATNATAASLHMLGGVAGWAWPFGGDGAIGKPAMTVHVEYADGDKEAIVLKNGEHFADYIGRAEVPLSDDAGDFTRRGQLRYLAVNLKKKAHLKKLTLETSGTIIAPCTVAITASAEKAAEKSDAGTPARKDSAPNAGKSARTTPESGPKEGGKGDGPLVPATPVQWEAGKTRILVIGGGSSHNFAEFFGKTDVATLKAAGFTVHYTEDRDQAAAELKNADAAIISVNRKFFDTAEYRAALFDFAAAGKGIVMLHPGTWYGFGSWPELNAQIVGGGARGHDKIHPFDVKALKADHPVMKDVPASFTVEDELYYVNAEGTPEGTTAIEVLAETSNSDKYQKPHPSVWITKHPKARVVGIALGHDARTHDLKPFQQLLINAAKWAGGK
jgi:putative membrane-bound dehydrogenase-like protein